MTALAKPQCHRWGKPDRMAQKTERECLRGCRTVKTTLHPHGRDGFEHYVEYYRDGGLIGARGSKVPVCEPVEVGAA
jgi:hypothetical protein